MERKKSYWRTESGEIRECEYEVLGRRGVHSLWQKVPGSERSCCDTDILTLFAVEKGVREVIAPEGLETQEVTK